MDALIWTGPREMVLRDEVVPTPGPDEVLIEVSAAGICGSEISGYLGQNALRVPPLVMGHEASGRIAGAAQGRLADGRSAREGQRITFNPLLTCGECDCCHGGRSNLCRQRRLIGVHRPGAFARYLAVPVSQCWPLPDELADVTGALTEPLACAVRAVALAGVGPSDRLLILGAGTIGLCCLVVARTRGLDAVMVTDVSDGRLAVARARGACRTVNPDQRDPVATVHEKFPGGVDAVIDAVGTGATRSQAVRAVVPGGQVVLVGLHEEESVVPANYIVRQEIRITGSFVYTQDDFGLALRMLTDGVIRPSDDWLEERPLLSGAQAFAELADGRCRVVKVVLRAD